MQRFAICSTIFTISCSMITEGFVYYSHFSSVELLSRVELFAIPWTVARQASLSITNSQSCLLSWWCHPTISSSVVRFFSCLQSFLASGSFQMSQLFASDGQSIAVSASTSVLPMNTQDWSPLGWIGWISLLFKGLSRVFSSTTVWKHQFFRAQPSLWPNSQCLLLLFLNSSLTMGELVGETTLTSLGYSFLPSFLPSDPSTWNG